MDRKQRKEFLRTTELLSSVPEDFLDLVDLHLSEVSLRSGEILFNEGEAGDAVYLVYSGALSVENEGVRLLRRSKGECVGEFALIDDAPRSTSVIAESDVVLFRWEREGFRISLTQTSEVATGILGILLQKLREDVIIQVETAKELRKANSHLERENRSLKVQISPEPQIVSQSSRMREVLDLAWRVADTSSTVLLRGDSGTGKEVIARAIHRRSARNTGPFIPVHCASLPTALLESELFGHEKGAFTGATERRQGRFELANGGTLFLDEVGEIEPEVQVKLLRVLQERQFERVGGSKTIQVDVRVIAATNRNLEEGVKEGGFREDLYYRLNVIPIVLLPLRERREDIPLLLDHFIAHFARELGRIAPTVTQEALDLLVGYGWPGNVRELQNVVERILVVTDDEIIVPTNLPPEMIVDEDSASVRLGEISDSGAFLTLEEVQKRHIVAALLRCEWNQSHAADLLQISRDQLRHRIKKYGIEGTWQVGAPVRN
jgi:transcriptional regulator with PAS, ATPase and Fis domain